MSENWVLSDIREWLPMETAPVNATSVGNEVGTLTRLEGVSPRVPAPVEGQEYDYGLSVRWRARP
jgi:hypothetical protein